MLILASLVSAISDHPRRCGAFNPPDLPEPQLYGSSPQVRGIFTYLDALVDTVRIIPAGAGHLRGNLKIYDFPGDHPRRCGAFNG